jgi:Tfp pilus assembly protein PilP
MGYPADTPSSGNFNLNVKSSIRNAMPLPRRKLLIQQAVILVLACLAGTGVYLLAIAPATPSPRENIDAQLAIENLTGDALVARRAHLAVEHFVKDRNRPPSSLQALVPHYVAEVPRSTESGEPLPYFVKGTSPLLGKAATDALAAEEAAARQATHASSFDEKDITYEAGGRRDPFQPYDFAPKESDEGDGRPALERYELSQLKLTAIIAAGELSSATVEDASGRGFIVRNGTTIGVNRGSVTEILADKITVVETTTDSAGRSKTNTVTMRLRTKEQEELLQRGRR